MMVRDGSDSNDHRKDINHPQIRFPCWSTQFFCLLFCGEVLKTLSIRLVCAMGRNADTRSKGGIISAETNSNPKYSVAVPFPLDVNLYRGD